MLRNIRTASSKFLILQSFKKKYHINIPDRIERTSTSILDALAKTVGCDTTSANYKYHDDPYLIPASNASKRIFAMAHESGRKAARWIKDENNSLFMHEIAVPKIQHYGPKIQFNEESTVSENLLKEAIIQADVTNALQIYGKLKESDIKLNLSTTQSLLELLCYFNNNNVSWDEWIEERWFKKNNETTESKEMAWRDGAVAEMLFNNLLPKCSQSYCALIRGFAKYRQVERAVSLMEEASEKNIAIDITTFNILISKASSFKENVDERWLFAKSILNQMAQQRIRPNLGTLNSLLECISSFGNYKLARKCCLQTLAEFKELNIEPSLATYYYILVIFCRDRAPVSHVLGDILSNISGKQYIIRDSKDICFFATAMDVCRNHLNDKNLAKTVNDLLNIGKNYNLIGDSYKEAVYYRHFFALLCQTETIDEFMKVYDQLVPNIYTPEPGIMEEILQMIEMNEAFNLVPRIWSDIVIFNYVNRQSLLQKMIRILNSGNFHTFTFSEELLKKFAAVGMEIFRIIISSDIRSQSLSLNGKMAGEILMVSIRGKKFDDADEIFQYIKTHQNSISGTPSESALMSYVDSCISRKLTTNALQCIEYSYDNNIDIKVMLDAIRNGLNLNENQLLRIRSLFGDKN